ncbi:hypothetical protein HPB51_000684 [Rhipicephalus microplus]|uniref:Uncharacterized protein n=1 Tax=Rhipicephalus microplus TaxID=6941 RepID=A0A9J6ER13_RHIMP|nr:hypothetical protein HPB51_000684 [Rhipicephalus microplus]
MTATQLESAALLLETQIAVDDPSKDLPEHAEARQMAARPYDFNEVDVPFTEAEVREVIGAMPPRSSPGPDAITPLLVKALFKLHVWFVVFVLVAPSFGRRANRRARDGDRRK